jgi:hypothetical protein
VTNGELVRVSDAERDSAVLQLREHLAEGRLSLEEFTERMSTAYAAAPAADLELPLRDLPAPTRETRRRRTRLLAALLSSTERQGRFRLGRRVVCLAALGNIDLDLRQATLESDEITIVVFGLFATADVYVPEGIEADITGFTVFGHRNARGNDVQPLAGMPLVRVLAFGVFVGFDLWRVPAAWAKRTWSEVIRGIRRGEHKELTS